MSVATRSGPGGWLDRHPETYPALRKAIRTTVTACIGFFGCRYGLGDTVMATYALFGAIAVGALSDVFGPPSVRTKVHLGALPVAALLVTLGTFAAAHLWTAVLGVLVVGFVVAYAGVGGPRVVGLANGMQLFYILPCFPPYAPETLAARLIGLTIGISLVTIADRVLLPEPAPNRFATRVADAADLVVTYLDAIRDSPGTPHHELRALTRHALEQLRLTVVPLNERPIGPGCRDRGLMHAAGSIRIIGARASVLDELPCTEDAPPVALIIELLGTVRDVLNQTAAALRGLGPAPSTTAMDRVIDDYLRRRADWVAQRGDQTEPPDGLRASVATLAVAEATRGIVAATRAALGAAWPGDDPVPPTAWYLHASPIRLWGERLLSNFTPRSVYLQNAVRLALGLAVARTAVDLLHLSHGLWVLLATLTLMRTTLVASGTALLPAIGGTLIGAALGAGLLTAVGGHAVVYALVLPVVMLVSFTVGTVLGPVYGQAGFTLVVSAAFAQLAPADWTLAGTRLLDVVAGGLIGTVIGAAVWPRGGAGELRRIAERSLRLGADDMVATVDVLSGVARTSGRAPTPVRSRASRLAVLFEHAYSQYRTEPGKVDQRDAEADPDWLVVLAIMRRMAGEAELLIGRHPDAGPLPWPSVGPRIDAAAQDVARGFRHVAEAIAGMRASDCGATALQARLMAQPPTARYATEPRAALRALDAWGWLHVLAHDLDRVERAVQPRGAQTSRTAATATTA